MSFNISKSKITSITSVGDTRGYMLNGSVLDHVDSTKYLGVTLQSDCKFNKRLSNKLLDARRQLGMVYCAPERAQFIAYKALCLPHLKYASAVWGLTCKKYIADLERIQIDATRFFTNTKGRDIRGAMEELSLQLLEQRRKK